MHRNVSSPSSARSRSSRPRAAARRRRRLPRACARRVAAPSAEPSARPRRRADHPLDRWSRSRRRSIPTMAQDSQSTGRPDVGPSRPRLHRQGPERRAGLGRVVGHLGRRQDHHLPPARTPSTATATRSSPADLVYSWKRLVDPRTAAPYATSWPRSRVAATCSPMAGADPAADGCGIDAALEKFGVAAPDDKTFVVTLAIPATYFLSVADAVGRRSRSRRSGSPPKAPPRPANYVSSGPFTVESWDHNSADHPEAEPELVRRRSRR